MVLARGCHDAAVSYSPLSPSGDKGASSNPAPPEDLSVGSSVVPRPDQPGAGACPRVGLSRCDAALTEMLRERPYGAAALKCINTPDTSISCFGANSGTGNATLQ